MENNKLENLSEEFNDEDLENVAGGVDAIARECLLDGAVIVNPVDKNNLVVDKNIMVGNRKIVRPVILD